MASDLVVERGNYQWLAGKREWFSVCVRGSEVDYLETSSLHTCVNTADYLPTAQL